MNRLSLLIIIMASTLWASCGSWRRNPKELHVDHSPPRSTEAIVLDRLQATFNPMSIGKEGEYFKAKGQAQIQVNGNQQKVRLEIRLRVNELSPVAWFDVADPVIGIKLARGISDDSDVRGYAHIINRSFSESLDRLVDAGIPFETMDIIKLLTRNPLDVPSSVVGMNLDTYSSGSNDFWKIEFPVRRGGHAGRMTLHMLNQSPYTLFAQEVVIPSMGAFARIDYQNGQSWIIEFKGSGMEGWMKFSPTQASWDESPLSFPFKLPSGYAKVDF